METLSKKNISETVNEIAQKIVSAEATNNFESLRKNAYDSLVSLGLPNKKNEEYKYANPEKFFKNGLSPAIASQANIKEVVEKYRSVFSNAQIATLLNGFVVKEFTDDSFQSSNSFSQIGSVALTDKDYFAALNTAMFPEALVINASVEQAEIRIIINIVSLPDAISSPRIFINAPKNANIQVIEITEVLPTASNSVCNLLTEINIEENAKAFYYRLQHAGANDNSINSLFVNQAKNSFFDTNVITLSGGWVRNNLSIFLKGTNAESHLNGLLLSSNTQFTDNHTLVDHQAPNCNSNQLYKGVLKDKSIGVFNGKIFVQRDAQKTNAYQSSKNILLSDDATINTKPQLEIYADDVKCSHGSSTGKIDNEALFYLKARGIGEEGARSLLLFAFANSVLNTLQIETYKNYVQTLLEEEF